MKRKHFTKPRNLSTFGNWLFAEMFIRNITINELAIKLNTSRPTIINYMQHDTRIPGHRILQICAILSPTVMHYHNMVTNAMRALPNYYTIYNTFTEGQQCQK